MSSFVLLFTPFYAICPPFQEAPSGDPNLQSWTVKNLHEFPVSTFRNIKNIFNFHQFENKLQ
jgi:hypothetical protein